MSDRPATSSATTNHDRTNYATIAWALALIIWQNAPIMILLYTEAIP